MKNLLFFLASLLVATRAIGATKVEVVVDEPYRNRSVRWPITTGVPFPRGALTDADQCRLVDDQNVEQLLQTKIRATWDRKQSSIRWLTIDFVARPGRKYYLEFGPDVRRARTKSKLVVDKQGLAVVTGPLKTEFSLEGGSSLAGFYLDLDSNGQFRESERIARGADDGEHFYINQDGHRLSSAGDGNARQVVIESVGPVRACFRVDGYYSRPKDERIVRYRTRYHFFTGMSLVKVVDEFKIVGSTQNLQFKDIGFDLKLTSETAKRVVSGGLGGKSLDVPWKAGTKAISFTQQTYRHYGNPECIALVTEENAAGTNELHRAEQMDGWLQARDSKCSITGGLRWFWQQFPKQWEVKPNKLILHLWSPSAGALDFGTEGVYDFLGEAGKQYLLNWRKGRPPQNPLDNYFYFAGHRLLRNGKADGQGTNKHHEFYLHFARPNASEAASEYGRLATRQPIAMASGKWNCSTDVFGPLMPRDDAKPDKELAKYEAIVDRLFDLGRDAQDSFGDYGWWLFGAGPHYSYQWDAETTSHYADPRRFEFHTYQKETQLWWNYVRSGERKFYDWAIPSENHWIDIAVAHVPIKFECSWRGGDAVERRTMDWRPGDWSIDSPYHYLRHHDTAEAWLRSGAQFWASYHRTLETTTLAYYLTGDERYNDVVKFWRNYWADLAGKTSASVNVKPWHREQPWFRATSDDEKAKTWAEMIRDYAPFSSGSRHQMTLFFNLATLYEHTWDPKIGQVLREYADAFLDPQHEIGVWRSQENSLPRAADAPTMAHYWIPALWKYHRATGDPRMPEVFNRFFDAAYAADPFGETRDVGKYSDLHHGYAYYFTKDPRHLTLASIELDRLLPNGEPLDRPEDLNRRLYNPYAPIQCFAAVPRLLWAMNDARRNNVTIPSRPVLQPQRAALAIHKRSNQKVTAMLWGFDETIEVVGPSGELASGIKIRTRKYASHRQPFDRTLPQFEAYLHELSIPSSAATGHYLIAPELEMGVVACSGEDGLLCNASTPISLSSGQMCWLTVAGKVDQIQFRCAQPQLVQASDESGKSLSVHVEGNRAAVDIVTAKAIKLKNQGPRTTWIRLVEMPVEQCWVSFEKASKQSPSQRQSLAAVRIRKPIDAGQEFVMGRFGQAVQITPNRRLHLPDHTNVDGKIQRLFDSKRGTVEFWIKRLWDERLNTPKRAITHISNGLIRTSITESLPLDAWAHIAVVWRPFKRDPSRTCVHLYVNGRDRGNYRSVWWKGYGTRLPTFSTNGKWLQEFLVQATTGTSFLMDDLRVSSTPRYADLDVEFGPQQTFNPIRFTPPDKPLAADEDTFLLFRFDGDLKNSTHHAKQPGYFE